MAVVIDLVCRAQTSALNAFARDRLSYGETLICPLLLVWRAYKDYCKLWGFHQVSAENFVFWIESQRHIHIVEKGRGKLKRAVIGIGVLPK